MQRVPSELQGRPIPEAEALSSPRFHSVGTRVKVVNSTSGSAHDIQEEGMRFPRSNKQEPRWPFKTVRRS